MAFVDTVNSLSNMLLSGESPVELTITNNTITIDPNSGSYFFLDGIDSNLTINISSLSASSKTIYLRLNFEQDNIVINWPNNIKWQEISSPSISQYEDLFISLMTLDGGTTWYSEPVIKTKPIVDLSGYMRNKDLSGTYKSLTSLPITDLNYFNSVRPISCYCMFSGCSSLTSIDLSDFDTSNVTNMHGMFVGCESLTSIDVSNFDTSNVTNMQNMFSGCNSLTSLDLSNWDTSNVTDMQYMFQYCTNLVYLDVSKLNITKTISKLNDPHEPYTGYDRLFDGCSNIQYLILENNSIVFNPEYPNRTNLNTTCKILVPAALLNTYKTATNWSSRASQFDAIENYTITRSNGQVTVTPNS